MQLYKVTNYFYPHRILDIGANVGQFYNLAIKNFPDSYIFSIEANKECEEELKKVTNNYHICLLGKDNQQQDFYIRKNDPTCTGNSVYKELTPFYSDDQIQIDRMRSYMLDDLFTEDSIFDLIKIDTQGSELDILTGGKNLCSKSSGIILEVSYTEYNEKAPLHDEVLSFMENYNFVPMDTLDEQRNHGSHQKDILFINKKIIK